MVRKNLFRPFILSLALSSGCAGDFYNGPRESWGHMMGYGYYGGLMWLITIIIAVIIIYLLLRTSGAKNARDAVGENPLDILKRRYARGEIDKEEFEQKKRDLES